MTIDRNTIESLVGTKISNIDLYQKAFTHKSALKEDTSLTGSFETLEFIGDSVLGFVITKFLYDKYEDRQEGFLTKARTKLVRGETLAGIASKLELYKWIRMDEKGMRNQWIHNPKILEDVFEALIGAIYMDMGLLHAKEFILRIYNNPTHENGVFCIDVSVGGASLGSGCAKNKKQAEQNAAQAFFYPPKSSHKYNYSK